MISNIVKRIINVFNNKKNVTQNLGRWNLKHNQESLEIFYRNIPDPGYQSIYTLKKKEFIAVPKPKYIRG